MINWTVSSPLSMTTTRILRNAGQGPRPAVVIESGRQVQTIKNPVRHVILSLLLALTLGRAGVLRTPRGGQ